LEIKARLGLDKFKLDPFLDCYTTVCVFKRSICRTGSSLTRDRALDFKLELYRAWLYAFEPRRAETFKWNSANFDLDQFLPKNLDRARALALFTSSLGSDPVLLVSCLFGPLCQPDRVSRFDQMIWIIFRFRATISSPPSDDQTMQRCSRTIRDATWDRTVTWLDLT